MAQENILQGIRNFFTGTKFSARNWVVNYANKIMGQRDAVWIDTQKPADVYNEIPQLKSVIDRKASMFSNMEIKLIETKNGDTIQDEQLFKLIQNPNVLQSMNAFLREYKTQEQVFGNQFLYKIQPSRLSKYPVALKNIQPSYIKPILSGKWLEQVELIHVIEKYEFCGEEKTRFIDTNNILYSRIANMEHPIIGTSPLVSLKFPLTNTKLAYQYRNVIMAEKGAIGILSNKSKDSNGPLPITPKEKEALLNEYSRKYGIDDEQRKIILTDAELNWQPMTYPTKDMLLFEEIDANMLTIIDAFGLNPNIFANAKATYENVKQGIVLAYQDTVIPEADQFLQSLGKFLNVAPNTMLVASYDHVPFMKEVNQKKYQTLGEIVLSLKSAVQSGFIASEQAEGIIAGELGIEPDTNAGKTLSILNSLSPLVANNVLMSMTRNQVLELVGLPRVESGDVPVGQVSQPTIATPL